MKKLIFAVVALSLITGIGSGPTSPGNPFGTEIADAACKRIQGYTRRDGTYVSSHWRDTSNDGWSGNNANYQGLND